MLWGVVVVVLILGACRLELLLGIGGVRVVVLRGVVLGAWHLVLLLRIVGVQVLGGAFADRGLALGVLRLWVLVCLVVGVVLLGLVLLHPVQVVLQLDPHLTHHHQHYQDKELKSNIMNPFV